ncbi:c-type cytochrome [Akkermansiaceae bacterium]|nr:c-type cytochrome [Akkermansiaceae bacterium]
MGKQELVKNAALHVGLALVFTGFASALPEGWKITEFASPPEAEYPTAISAAANGDIYISADRNGSLGHSPDFGKIVRATDKDGDGKADEFQDFVPHVTSPRGGHYINGTFYLIHPPYLSAYRDTNGDGVADENKVLVKGFGWGIEHPRGADHTTNGVRMGIDGWLYVAVGDFGMPDAVGADGTRVTLWGGGVARVRPDGSELEIYSYNLRNICDIAITPTLDMFSRDNTNDGKGWNTRFHHYVPMGDHGYPRLYQKFANETVQALKDYGGGSGTGALALDEPGFPAEYKNAIFTCDWTTGNIYRHPMKPMEATFQVEQEIFHPLTRAVDIDVDGSSRLYLADWRNGRFNYDAKQKVGMIHQVLPPGWEKRDFPDLKKMADAELADQIGSDSAVMRLEAQREMISRGGKNVFADKMLALAKDGTAGIAKRVAAIFTYKQIFGEAANQELNKLAGGDASIREFVLRALADRKTQLKGVDHSNFALMLKHEDPRVRLQAINGLARLGAKESAPAILKAMDGMNLDSGKIDEAERRVVPHVAVKALADLKAVEACLAAVKSGTGRELAFRALQEMHIDEAVDGLISIAESNQDAETTEGALLTIARLHFKEAKWDLNEWWSTRPDDRGPYYKPTAWEATPRIRAAIEANFPKVPEARRGIFISKLADNRIPVSELKLPGLDPVVLALSVQQPDDSILALLSGAAADPKRDWEQRLLAYQAINRAEPKKAVPMMVKTLAAWVEAKEPNAGSRITDFVNETRRFTEINILNNIAKKGSDTESMIAWKAMLTVLNSPLVKDQNKEETKKLLAKKPMEVGLFLAIEDMKLTGFDTQIEAGIASDNEKTIAAAKRAREAASSKVGDGRKVGEMDIKEVAQLAMKNKGDAANGERLYLSQGCIACHAIDLKAAQKGPYLGAAGAKFERDYLIQSILDPNAVVAQGFQTSVFTMNDGKAAMGFVTGEEDGIVEVRDIAGQVSTLKRSEVKEEKHLPQSMMPPGLANPLTVSDFTDLVEYLVSLRNVGG